MDQEKTVMKLFDASGRQIAEIPLSHRAVEVYNKGVDFSKQCDTERAIALFKEAIRMEPRCIDAHYNLAVTYYACKQMVSARKEYEKVLELRPQDVDALNNLGAIIALGGELEQAKKLFDKALNFDPNFALTHRNLAAYYKAKGDITKIAEHVKKAIELDAGVFDREPGPPRIQPKPDF